MKLISSNYCDLYKYTYGTSCNFQSGLFRLQVWSFVMFHTIFSMWYWPSKQTQVLLKLMWILAVRKKNNKKLHCETISHFVVIHSIPGVKFWVNFANRLFWKRKHKFENHKLSWVSIIYKQSKEWAFAYCAKALGVEVACCAAHVHARRQFWNRQCWQSAMFTSDADRQLGHRYKNHCSIGLSWLTNARWLTTDAVTVSSLSSRSR